MSDISHISIKTYTEPAHGWLPSGTSCKDNERGWAWSSLPIPRLALPVLSLDGSRYKCGEFIYEIISLQLGKERSSPIHVKTCSHRRLLGLKLAVSYVTAMRSLDKRCKKSSTSGSPFTFVTTSIHIVSAREPVKEITSRQMPHGPCPSGGRDNDARPCGMTAGRVKLLRRLLGEGGSSWIYSGGGRGGETSCSDFQ